MNARLASKFLVVFVMLTLVIMVKPAKAQVEPLCDFEWMFYNSTFTTQVGDRRTNCGGVGVTTTGSLSNYYWFTNNQGCAGYTDGCVDPGSYECSNGTIILGGSGSCATYQ
jgi:hypothetical protein